MQKTCDLHNNGFDSGNDLLEWQGGGDSHSARLKQKLFVDALREAMLRYMKDQEFLEEHKRNARIIFDAQFDLEKVAQQYLTFFKEAISNGKMHNGRE